MSDQWRPQPQHYRDAPPRQDGPSRGGLGYAILAGLVVVLAGLLAVATGAVAFGGTSDALEVTEQAPPPPVFEPAFTEGVDAFFPLSDQIAALTQTGQPALTQQAIATGLYGGTAENTCDPQRLIDYLVSNPAKGRAWAQVQGIPFEQIPAYINSLSARVLAAPATVLNHGFDAATGAPYEVETTLDAGTAVLIDAAGDIRTRCYCGNPIKPKAVGHKPPRCIQVPTLVYSNPGGKDAVGGVRTDVVLTGRVTTDLAWTEISWGTGQTGWTPHTNLSKYICTIPIGITPTPFPTPPATPYPTPFPTPHPTPDPTPFQPTCSVSKTRVEVGEEFEISGVHVPSSLAVTWAFDHGDGTIDQRNPSAAFYNQPGFYDVVGLVTPLGGTTRSIPCGTVEAFAPDTRFRIGCSVSNTRPTVGATSTITARTIDPDLAVTWEIHHGDGFIDTTNPSVATYQQPGEYDVRVIATTFDGRTAELFCGTMFVAAAEIDLPFDRCSAPTEFVGLHVTMATAKADNFGCIWRLAHEPGTQDYRPERLNFVLDQSDTVIDVLYN